MMDPAVDQLTKATSMKEDSIIFLTDGATGESYYMTIGELLSDSLNAAVEMLKLGTMAYEDKYQYALVHHDHDAYSQFSYQKNQSYSSQQSTEVIARVMSNGTATQIECPQYPVVKRFEQHDIGELMFLYKMRYCVDVSHPDFDGWVPPDGKTYRVNLFAASNRDFLKKFFPYERDPELIQVPDFSERFFRPVVDCCDDNATRLQSVEYQNGIKPHTHVYAIPTTTEITSFEFSAGSSSITVVTDKSRRSDKKFRLFAEKASENSVQKTVQTEMSCSWSADVRTKESHVPDEVKDHEDESCPPHMYIPALIYLGPNSSQSN